VRFNAGLIHHPRCAVRVCVRGSGNTDEYMPAFRRQLAKAFATGSECRSRHSGGASESDAV
jgi:hypothetical protein